MESLEDKIRRFLSVGSGSGSGSGYGYGSGDGSGYGDGSGDGSGYGSGSGSGYGDGSGSGELKSYNHRKVYYIDDVPTLIDSVRGNVACGFMINRDKTLSACYVVKVGNCFAHGETTHAAHEDALAKHMQDIPEEERINMFVEAHPDLDAEHPCEDLFRWHNTLTGSCEFGRQQFCRDNGISLNERYTVRYFLDITKNAYGGSIIRKVRERYDNKGNE